MVSFPITIFGNAFAREWKQFTVSRLEDDMQFSDEKELLEHMSRFSVCPLASVSLAMSLATLSIVCPVLYVSVNLSLLTCCSLEERIGGLRTRQFRQVRYAFLSIAESILGKQRCRLCDQRLTAGVFHRGTFTNTCGTQREISRSGNRALTTGNRSARCGTTSCWTCAK